jgi:membrane protease YdiL (CAAX protease family)
LSLSDNPQFDKPPNTDPQAPVPLVVNSFPPPEFPPISPAPISPAPKSDENPVWSGWDVLQIAGLALGSVFVLQALILFGAKRFVYPNATLRDLTQKAVLAILAQLLAYVVVAVFMVTLVEGKYHVRFWQAIRWNWPGNAMVKLLGLGVLTVALDFLGRFLPMPKNTPFEQFFARPLDAYLISVFAITLGPLMEELFFRGFLYPVIARRLGVVWGVVLTAVPFGLIHSVQYGNAWSAVLIVCLVGVVLTTVRAVTKSVAASFLVHVGYNGTLMFLAALATDGFRHMDKAGMLLF